MIKYHVMVTENGPKSVGVVGRGSEIEVSINAILHVVMFEG